MNIKNILAIAGFIGFVVLYVNWGNGTLDPNKTEINDEVYLVKEDASYSIYCPQNGKGFQRNTYTKHVAYDVDSIIISWKYGTLFHGRKPSNKDYAWFYIDVSHTKNIYDGYTSVEEATASTMGSAYIDSIQTAEETWIKFN